MANEIGQRFIAASQVCILAALLFVVWQVRGVQRIAAGPTMTRTTEWTPPGGKLERFQSFREPEESFYDFRIRHESAVRELSRE